MKGARYCDGPRCKRTEITAVYLDRQLCLRCYSRIDAMSAAEFKAWLNLKNTPDGRRARRTR